VIAAHAKWIPRDTSTLVIGWVETFGRWNHMDIIFCMLMMLCFRMDIAQSDLGFIGSFLPAPIAQMFPVDVEIHARSGLYLYSLAVCGSMLLGHYAMFVTRKQRQIVQTAPYRLSARYESRPGVWYGTATFLFLNGILLLLAMFTPICSALYSLPLGITKPDRTWSIPTLIQDTAFLQQDDMFSVAGVLLVALLILCFTVVAPVCQLSCQASLWAFKLSPTLRHRVEEMLEISSLWCGLDVFLLATALVMEELGPLTSYFGRTFVKQMHLEQFINCNNNDCFQITMQREIGWYFILAHVLVSYAFYGYSSVVLGGWQDEGDAQDVFATARESDVEEASLLMPKCSNGDDQLAVHECSGQAVKR